MITQFLAKYMKRVEQDFSKELSNSLMKSLLLLDLFYKKANKV